MQSQIRATQRPPRTCTNCAKRKVRCDKRLPCHQCIHRGQADTCKLELVRVRGNLVESAPSHRPRYRNYAELLQENAMLRAMLAGQTAQTDVRTPETNAEKTPKLNVHGRRRTEDVVRRLFDEIGTSSRPRTVCELKDVILPSRDFSQNMVENAFQWTFWIHFALFTPQFRREHEEFWARIRANQSESLAQMDPSWMAIYFSVLASTLMFMDENENKERRPACVDFTSLLQNWYESALLFLDRADYMKKPDLPDEVDDDELQSVSGGSRLPKSKPRAVRYHIAIAEVAKVYHRLRFTLRLRQWDADEVARFVFDADEQLANLIVDLPSYLQSDEKSTPTTQARDAHYPFIPWQKKSLAKVLLYYRMAVSCQLQEHWLDGSTDGARTRAICMSSARGLIQSTLSETADASKLRPW
ncbi:hypothetical protein KVR01_009186 [Diaporthe batatas]|uniref:uncharacterized protein n=1 Tax=Diaporthe batatas TaxID=748121 RepID=UPI001D039B8B|nr:uncharacterized protein KVR01_009186 [Diaporthe batatas]KAG8160922.1 hypothetical protein KVR01_009186 [Diaporthe batatas]